MMKPVLINRRALLAGSATAAAALCVGSLLPSRLFAAQVGALPNSSGTERPALKAMPNACDAHIHIIDPRFAPADPAAAVITDMTVEAYRQTQARLGLSRVVIVQPKYYGTDNRCTLDAVAQFNGQARGIGVVHPSVSDEQLQAMHKGGIRGLRFSVWNPKDTVTTLEMLEPLAQRISALGWHVQLHMSGEQIVENEALLKRLTVPMVFDHMGRLPPEQGISHPAFAVISRLLDTDRAWVKLAGAYLNTTVGEPTYRDATEVARGFVRAAPERLVWGSDWPHTTEKTHKPDDALLFDLLRDWAPGADLRQRILVDNPERLYGFSG